MHRFWNPIIQPLAKAISAKAIIEVGCERGLHTRKILDYCLEHEAVLHAIDPLPGFDVDAWKEKYGETFVFYRELSLTALPKIGHADLVLLDGDHNWYTVINELRLIEESARNAGKEFPIVVLHDVAWPYARRDLYYNPQEIPPEFRHKHERAGIVPGHEELSSSGGLNPHYFNASIEGGPRNGVLTAIEDFLKETEAKLEFVALPLLNGVGVIASTEQAAKNRSLKSLLSKLRSVERHKPFLELIEADRVATSVLYANERRASKTQQEQLKQYSSLPKLAEVSRELRGLAEETAAAKAATGRVLAEVEQSRLESRNLKQKSTEAEAKLDEFIQEYRARLRKQEQGSSSIRVSREVSKIFESQRGLDELDRLLHFCAQEVNTLHTMIFSRSFTYPRRVSEQLWRTLYSGSVPERAWVPERFPALSAQLEGCKSKFNLLKRQVRTGSGTSVVADHEIASLRAELGRLAIETRACANSVRASRSFKLGLAVFNTPGCLLSQPGALMLRRAVCSNVDFPSLPAESLLENQEEHSSLLSAAGEHAGSVIVCVHNALSDVKACLHSVLQNTNLNVHRLVIVDDGSDDETAHYLRRFSVDSRVTLLRNDSARGYTKAANQGIGEASGDFVVLLNSDVIVPPGWLERLARCAFSRPGVAVVGPLSNAASWQTIPQLRSAEGRWAVNDVPEGKTLEEFADALAASSQRLYPEVQLVNGFCYLITRAALEAVGTLDEEAFPTGYGEEDDFSLRAQAAGFVNLVADDCYLFHAKSKSFGPARRNELAERGMKALKDKHSADRVRHAVMSMQENDNLTVAREYACISERDESEAIKAPAPASQRLRIGWIKPHLGCVGGVRRTIEMTNRLYARGHDVKIFTPRAELAEWMPMWAEVGSFEDLSSTELDVLIVSDPDVIQPFLQAEAPLKIVYHLAAYMIYREPQEDLKAYYERTKNCRHIANSNWTAEHVFAHSGAKCDAIFEGAINRTMFAPRRQAKRYDVACYGSSRPHKGTAEIAAACEGLNLLKVSEQAPSQVELSRLISSARVFASACWHEGFSFCPLEAMACGVPVAMTDDGGSREYARHEENALVSNPKDIDALRGNILRLLNEPELRAKLIKNGLETAQRFSWERLVLRFENFLLDCASSKAVGAPLKHVNGVSPALRS